MKHKILTPIITMGGIGGVTTPIVINTTGIGRPLMSMKESEPSSDAQIRGTRSAVTTEHAKRDVVNYPKRSVSSLFL